MTAQDDREDRQMIICASTFMESPPDLTDPDVAMHEVDYYQHTLDPTPKNPSHRLAMRYRHTTNEYEVYRRFPSTGGETIAFRGKLVDAIVFSNEEVKRLWGGSMGNDRLCTHVGSGRAYSCRVKA